MRSRRRQTEPSGRHQEALEEVYWIRIQREDERFNPNKLGAFGSEVAVLSAFFDRTALTPARLRNHVEARGSRLGTGSATGLSPIMFIIEETAWI
ncbi:Hypothetical protein A7982_11951 [Minicystis rosea]|nr:Hypothetical protein A7982_11951 [Minicystis rosea]